MKILLILLFIVSTAAILQPTVFPPTPHGDPLNEPTHVMDSSGTVHPVNCPNWNGLTSCSH